MKSGGIVDCYRIVFFIWRLEKATRNAYSQSVSVISVDFSQFQLVSVRFMVVLFSILNKFSAAM